MSSGASLRGAGDLRYPIHFNRATVPAALDNYGAPVPEYITVYRCRAARESLSGTEQFQAQQFVARAWMRFVIHFTSAINITPTEKLVLVDELDGNREYDITDVDVDEAMGQGKWLVITGTARAEAEAAA